MVQREQAVYADGQWNGRPLRDWIPEIVDDIVKVASPRRVILFGSVVKGDEGPDSDLDFLIVLDDFDAKERVRKMGEIRLAIGAPVPIDVFVTDVDECERRKDVIGSLHYWPLREGKVVYERVA